MTEVGEVLAACEEFVGGFGSDRSDDLLPKIAEARQAVHRLRMFVKRGTQEAQEIREVPMKFGHFYSHWTTEIPVPGDEARTVPAGGVSSGRGFTISWQNGPLGRGEGRVEPNGAFVEDLIQAVIERIKFYQLYFPCEENAMALRHLFMAAEALDYRTRTREARGVEGTHTA